MEKEALSGHKGPKKQLAAFRLKAVLENVPLAVDKVTECAQAVGVDARTLYEIQLAVDEACANVVHHAYEGVDAGEVEVSCYLDHEVLIIHVRDWGTGFDPGSVERPVVDAPLEERTLGGLGLFIVEQVMDHVQFAFDAESGNDLMMVKRLKVAEA